MVNVCLFSMVSIVFELTLIDRSIKTLFTVRNLPRLQNRTTEIVPLAAQDLSAKGTMHIPAVGSPTLPLLADPRNTWQMLYE